MLSIVGMLIGLVPTYMVSAIMIWLMKTWQGGVRKLVLAHLASLLVMMIITGMGSADGGAFAPIFGLQMYIIPQAFWLAFDIYQLKRRQAKAKRAETGQTS